MAFILSRNLKLRIDSNLTANAKYNLEKLDLLASSFLPDSTDALIVRAVTDITVEPESADIGGSGSGGSILLGTTSHTIDDVSIYATRTQLNNPIYLLDKASGGTKYLGIRYKSDLSNAVDTGADRTLSIDLEGADRSLVLGGNLTTTGGALNLTLTGTSSLTLPAGTDTLVGRATTDTLTNKSISATSNALSNIGNSSIAANAAIDYSKLNLATSIVNADISASAAIAGTKISPDFGSQVISTAESLKFQETWATYLRAAQSGQTSDLTFTLPSSAGTAGYILSTDGNGNLSWTAVGAGTVTSIGMSVPAEFSVSPASLTSSGTFTISKVSQTANQVYAGPTSGASAAPTFRTLVSDDIPNGIAATKVGDGTVSNAEFAYLGNVTSDIQIQLDGKQTLDSDLTALAGLSSTGLISRTGSGTAAVRTITGDADITVTNGGGIAGNPTLALSTTGVSGNSYGSATQVGTFTVDTRGRLTAAASTSIAIPSTQVTDFTEAAQDAVGSTLTDTSTIDLTYTDAAGTIEAAVKSDSLTNTHINSAAAIAYSKLALTGSILNADISGSAAIAYSKLAALMADRALTSNGSGVVTVSAVTATELGYVSGVTSAIQTQLNAITGRNYATDWITADGTTKAVTHSLGSLDVMVEIYDKTNGETIQVDTVIRTDTNTLTLTSTQAPGAAGWRVLIYKVA